MGRQYTDTIMMIRPVSFRLNEQTMVNNYYQKAIEGLSPEEVQQRALLEFDHFVDELRAKGINVIVVDDTIDPDTPDSIFPNNWVSFHNNAKVALYPMCAPNRRLERRMDILELLDEHGFLIEQIEDFTENEESGIFLEGTGSMVLDRVNKVAYAAISIRTDEELFEQFCERFGYRSISFVANQTVNGERLPIYHTNVMMCVADKFAVICLDTIDDVEERQEVIEALEDTDKEIIEITEEQKEHFAGNMLQVRSKQGEVYLVMSAAAYQSLETKQIETIEKYCPIIHSSLDTIEALGGGSARCMMAEIFLPKK